MEKVHFAKLEITSTNNNNNNNTNTSNNNSSNSNNNNNNNNNTTISSSTQVFPQPHHCKQQGSHELTVDDFVIPPLRREYYAYNTNNTALLTNRDSSLTGGDNNISNESFLSITTDIDDNNNINNISTDNDHNINSVNVNTNIINKRKNKVLYTPVVDVSDHKNKKNKNKNNKNKNKNTNKYKKIFFNLFSSFTDNNNNKGNQTDNDDVDLTPPATTKILSLQEILHSIARRFPGLLIALILNLMLGVPFGLSFFPAEWDPFPVSRAIGIQMFLFSTFISQLFLSYKSNFEAVSAMMMVENIPFMHQLATGVIEKQGLGVDSLSTVVVLFSFSSIVCGIFFFCLGYFKQGGIVHYFPRNVIMGCIGGIGVFVTLLGLEVSTGQPWKWDGSYIWVHFFSQRKFIFLWLPSILLVILLRIIRRSIRTPLLSPFFFTSIPIVFYIICVIFQLPVAKVREMGFLFEKQEDEADWTLMWTVIDLKVVRWDLIFAQTPTIIALTIFSLMHVPINIPSLSLTTGKEVDMDIELIGHGYSNIMAGCVGSIQNYLCYSNSALYYKSGGGGPISNYLLALFTLVFFFMGPSILAYIPRCMAGSLLIHVGLELTSEGVIDCYREFDVWEYSTALIICCTMTFADMTVGLGVGVLLACITFVIQSGKKIPVIRGNMSAATLRSSATRPLKAQQILDEMSRTIFVVQLQGQLFFGNVSLLRSQIHNIILKILEENHHFNQDESNSVDNSDNNSYSYSYSNSNSNSNSNNVTNNDYENNNSNIKKEEEGGSRFSSSCFSPRLRNSASSVTGHKNELNFVILDFTLVTALDSSAVDVLSKIPAMCHQLDISCVFAGNEMISPYLQQISHTNNVSKLNQQVGSYSALEDGDGFKFHVACNIDSALEFCEDSVIKRKTPSIVSKVSRDDIRKNSRALDQLVALANEESEESLSHMLKTYFIRKTAESGHIMWYQDDKGDSAFLLESGSMLSVVEEEAGTTENIEHGVICGESGLLLGDKRRSTLIATEQCIYHEISADAFRKMKKNDSHLVIALQKIAMRYMMVRMMHVSNRIWETKCLPV